MGGKVNDTSECEVKEDEEQGLKLQEIIDLLVAAGYFRARIKGLSAFDKVVGGMIWSMDSCDFDVNVDLLFQENSTIGKKIALTEKIVTVLPRMGCPHRIEPHQIQGLDFIHIFPVIQWLVKRSVKLREEKREFIRANAVLKFDKQYHSKDFVSQPLVDNIKRIQDSYRRKRLFKRREGLPDDKALQIESTLLEYGFPYIPLNDKLHSDVSNSFSEAQEFSDALPLKVMGSIVNSQGQKIAQVSQQFAKLKMEMEDSGTTMMKRHKDLIIEKKNTLLEEEEKLKSDIETLNNKMTDIKDKIRQFNEITQEKTGTQLRLYEDLQTLILTIENLKKQEQSFRDYCRATLDSLQSFVKEACDRNKLEENSATDNLCEEEREKVQALRLQIAKKNRSIAFLQRQLDEIPGRGELAQYQRRFLELYNEVAQKHEETKQFYTMYNTLDDTKLYLTKELSLLNSVLDNYSEAMTNSIDKEEFMKQFEFAVAAIKQNKQKVEKRKAEERTRRDKLSKQLLELIEQQRNYVNIVKQLKVECKRNEELLSRFRKQQ